MGRWAQVIIYTYYISLKKNQNRLPECLTEGGFDNSSSYFFSILNEVCGLPSSLITMIPITILGSLPTCRISLLARKQSVSNPSCTFPSFPHLSVQSDEGCNKPKKTTIKKNGSPRWNHILQLRPRCQHLECLVRSR